MHFVQAEILFKRIKLKPSNNSTEFSQLEMKNFSIYDFGDGKGGDDLYRKPRPHCTVPGTERNGRVLKRIKKVLNMHVNNYGIKLQVLFEEAPHMERYVEHFHLWRFENCEEAMKEWLYTRSLSELPKLAKSVRCGKFVRAFLPDYYGLGSNKKTYRTITAEEKLNKGIMT